MITIVAASIADALAPDNPLRPEGADEGDVEIITWRFAERGARLSATQYLRAVAGIRAIGERLAAFFARYDVLLTPTMAQPPMRLGALDPCEDDPDGSKPAVGPLSGQTEERQVGKGGVCQAKIRGA